MQCRHCGTPLRRGVGVCPVCGTPQPRSATTVRCRACGRRSHAALQVCPHCGRNLRPGLPIPWQAMGLGILGVLVAVFLISRINLGSVGQTLSALAPTTIFPTSTNTPARSAPTFLPDAQTEATPTQAIEGITPVVDENTPTVVAITVVTETQTLTSAAPTFTATPTPTLTTTPTPTFAPTATPTPTFAPTATPTTPATPTKIPATNTPTRAPETPTPVSTPAGTVRYTIKAGDTLAAIAVRFDTTVASLLALNPGLNPSRLRVGQVILVAGAAPAASDTPAPQVTPTVRATGTASVQMSAPILTGPASGSAYNGDDAIILLNWQSAGALPDSVAYLLEIGYRVGGNFDWRASEVTTTTGWRVSNLLYGQAEQETGRRYSWRVTMVSVTVDSAGRVTAIQRISPASETREFLWN